MVRFNPYNNYEQVEDKAGYNQAGKITELLALLRTTFTSAMMQQPNDFDQALESCRGVLNIISGKVKAEEIDEVDELVIQIESSFNEANQTYVNSDDGNRYYRDGKKRLSLKKELEKLWRKIEKLQDKYGYGMMSEDDTGL